MSATTVSVTRWLLAVRPLYAIPPWSPCHDVRLVRTVVAMTWMCPTCRTTYTPEPRS